VSGEGRGRKKNSVFSLFKTKFLKERKNEKKNIFFSFFTLKICSFILLLLSPPVFHVFLIPRCRLARSSSARRAAARYDRIKQPKQEESTLRIIDVIVFFSFSFSTLAKFFDLFFFFFFFSHPRPFRFLHQTKPNQTTTRQPTATACTTSSRSPGATPS
jgi:hypothetical protein